MTVTSAVSSTEWWQNPTTVDSGTDQSSTDSLSNVETFLQLLATELQYQDPTEPVSNTEYVAQLAQFNSLQQLQVMNLSMNASQAYGLIGKAVTYQTTDSAGNTTGGSGVVQSVITQNNEVYLNVGGNKIQLSSVLEAGEATTTGAG